MSLRNLHSFSCGDRYPMIGGGNLPLLMKGKTRDKLAAYVGISYKTLQRAEEIVVAAEMEPNETIKGLKVTS
jgi:hypothetical protein